MSGLLEQLPSNSSTQKKRRKEKKKIPSNRESISFKTITVTLMANLESIVRFSCSENTMGMEIKLFIMLFES